MVSYLITETICWFIGIWNPINRSALVERFVWLRVEILEGTNGFMSSIKNDSCIITTDQNIN